MSKTKEIQRLIRAKGFYLKHIDGVFGRRTANAIIKALSQLPNPTAKLSWLKTAFSYLGLKEIKGHEHNLVILKFWELVGLEFINDDETPWCAGFVGAMLEKSGIKSSRAANARSYMDWGIEIKEPAVGCVAVFWRDDPTSWKGHVGFVVGKNEHNDLMILGGNQDNRVCIKPYSPARVLSCSWPENVSRPEENSFDKLPIVNSNGEILTNQS